MPLQIRTFTRVSEPGNVADAEAAVVAEANGFLATLPIADVADVRVKTAPFGKYGERAITTITVIYLETP